MQTDRISHRSSVMDFFAAKWRNWRDRRAGLAQLHNTGSAEMQRIAQDLNISPTELRVLAGHSGDAADLMGRRLHSLNIDPATIEPAVIRDMQRCCSQCGAKTLCEHELEDHPKAASWPKYCLNEHTIDALITEKKP